MREFIVLVSGKTIKTKHRDRASCLKNYAVSKQFGFSGFDISSTPIGPKSLKVALHSIQEKLVASPPDGPTKKSSLLQKGQRSNILSQFRFSIVKPS